MPSSTYPVLVPLRYPGSTALATLQVNAIAADAAEATADAVLIARHWVRLRRGDDGTEIVADRTRCGRGEAGGDGPALYILTGLDTVHSVQLPARIDSGPGEVLGQTLEGLDERQVIAVVLDCRRLTYVNTVGLTSLAAHMKRLRMYLCSVPKPVLHVLEIVGLSRYLTVHPDLAAALAAIPAGAPPGAPSSAG